MNRSDMVKRLTHKTGLWDCIVIGGGATGLGVAVDAASRGYETLLLEQGDFAQGTSSRSTKLIHGGVRYLQQGNVSLVLESLKERGLLRRNAPHLVHNIPFVVPIYDWWEGPFYGVGLKLYDWMAGKLGFGPSRLLSKERTIERIPTIEPDGLLGGVIYHDGQFDDARLAINLAQTAAELGATVLNYAEVIALPRMGSAVRGVLVKDLESGEEYELTAKVVINATGVFSDSIRRMDDPEATPVVTPSQGTHIVLDKPFLPGDSAVLVPHTDDRRVLFAVPWHDRVIVGTTDTPMRETPMEPHPLPEEVDFLLAHAGRCLTKNPGPGDVLSVFAGLRPLVSSRNVTHTAAICRDHVLQVSPSGLVTITGGKWTTYRKMAEDAVDLAAALAHLDEKPCITGALRIHGYCEHAEDFGNLEVYGSDAPSMLTIFRETPELDRVLHPNLPVRAGEVVWATRHEMARTVEDVLSRRTRSLLLDARASMEAALETACLMAKELGRDEAWVSEQVGEYSELARGYLL